MDRFAAALAGDRYALARLITLIEDGGREATAALVALYPRSGRAHCIGVTGAPGTGKSTLVSQLARHLRAAELTVGIIGVDPSSPFTGGALLGDRVRMRDLAGDQGVFMRSMATRGATGGLARATADVAVVLDAVGFDVVLIETVGAGQSEVEIARTAQTTIVVEAPESGDEVQALKAGLMEVADILVVNKADLPGAAHKVRALELAADRAAAGGQDADGWRTPVLQTVALDGTGAAALWDAVTRHRSYLQSSGLLARRRAERARYDLLLGLQHALLERLLAGLGEEQLECWIARIAARQVDVHEAMAQIVDLWESGVESP